MIRLLPLALLFLLFPAGAEAACGVAQSRAEYETPDAQVYVTKGRVLACDRATGLARQIGVRSGEEEVAVNGLLGGRYLHTSAESADARRDSLIDLRSGRYIRFTVQDEDTNDEIVALAGALVTAGPGGVVVNTIDRRFRRLSSNSADALAASGSRVYWREGDGAHTAIVALPAAVTGRSAPRARTIGRCRPRSGARLLVHDAALVVTRAGGATWACRRGRTRRVGVTDSVSVVTDRLVGYLRPGFAGVLDVVRGTRRELESDGGPLADNGSVLVAAGPGGVRSWTLGRAAAELVAPAPAAEVAVADQSVAYWIDGAGKAQVNILGR